MEQKSEIYKSESPKSPKSNKFEQVMKKEDLDSNGMEELNEEELLAMMRKLA
jgi:hypothetical protein